MALRAKGYKSWGANPDFTYFGGNSELRGYDYLQFVGQRAFFLNAELRFPLIEAMLTPIGILGGIRGVFFANAGGAGFNGQPFTFMASKDEAAVITEKAKNADKPMTIDLGGKTKVVRQGTSLQKALSSTRS